MMALRVEFSTSERFVNPVLAVRQMYRIAKLPGVVNRNEYAGYPARTLLIRGVEIGPYSPTRLSPTFIELYVDVDISGMADYDPPRPIRTKAGKRFIVEKVRDCICLDWLPEPVRERFLTNEEF